MTQHRPERVADRVRAVLARLLREEVRDPRVGFVTVTGVRLSPDLKYARVFVSLLGKDEQEGLEGLTRATPFLRRAMAREAGLRFTPELKFILDESVAGGFRIDQILDDVLPDEPPEES